MPIHHFVTSQSDRCAKSEIIRKKTQCQQLELCVGQVVSRQRNDASVRICTQTWTACVKELVFAHCSSPSVLSAFKSISGPRGLQMRFVEAIEQGYLLMRMSVLVFIEMIT